MMSWMCNLRQKSKMATKMAASREHDDLFTLTITVIKICQYIVTSYQTNMSLLETNTDIM